MYGITYDALGNPLQYRDGIALTWTNGRKLATFTKDSKTTTFTYDGEGNRIRKQGANNTVDYTVIGGVIYAEKRTSAATNILHFLFDETGNRIGFVHNNTDTYYYRFNLQGDVTGIYNSAGYLITEYTYDAWGKLLSMTGSNTLIGLINPIRYRGYYYDMETGLYYLNSRYYDPETCRFINADGLLSTGQGVLGYNMFAYCGNNPVNRADPSGQGWIDDLSKGLTNFVKEISFPISQLTFVCMMYLQVDYLSYLDALAGSESSNNYSIVSKSGKFWGRYQMGPDALKEAGFWDEGGNWTKLANFYGVNSKESFLASPLAQDVAITRYNIQQWRHIKNYGLDSYIGSVYCGVYVTQSGLLAACHLVGAYRMNEAVPAGKEVCDGNGTRASSYMNSYGNYDISWVCEGGRI
ncbi:MAG: RHS repeat-associated core domain-containing protein [Ruminococcaceae bacterium]|nr:RHS repeat-associated core domain-containing protein [Oscillospiraceae bacterium]